MTPTDYLQLLSIILEAAIALLCLRAAFAGRRSMYGLAITFAIYVYYDLAHLLAWTTPETLLRVSFLVATVTALYTVWHLQQPRADEG